MTDTFETFWTEWMKPPRRKHENRAGAEKAWNKAVRRGGPGTPRQIMEAMPKYKGSFSEKDAQYIRLASVWLNNDGHKDDYEALASNAMGFHKVPPKFCVTVNGRDYGFIEMMRVRDQIRRGRPVYDPEWTAFKKWQEHGHDSDVKLPPEPAKLPTPEEREAISKKWLEMKERGLL